MWTAAFDLLIILAVFPQRNDGLKRKIIDRFSCSGRPNGDYSDPNNCYGYIACSNGYNHRMQCPAGLVWNGATKRCDWRRNVNPPCGTLIAQTSFPTTDSFPNCGKRFPHKNAFQNDQKRIVGGKTSIQGSWPWQVALVIKGAQECGGSLINTEWIVTAAHCFHANRTKKFTKAEEWTVVLGEHKLQEKESFEQARKVEKYIIHPDYEHFYFRGILNVPPNYDIALVKLARPARLDQIVYPICLLRPGLVFPPGKECVVTGWGHTQYNGSKPEALNEVKVQLVSLKECNKNASYAGKIHGRALCAGFEKGGADACQYDSGGPLACQYLGHYYLTGIVSWGDECARPYKYGVYADMREMTSWVFQTIKRDTLVM